MGITEEEHERRMAELDASSQAGGNSLLILLSPAGLIVLGFIGFVLYSVAALVFAAFQWAGVPTDDHEFALSEYVAEVGFDPTIEHPVTIGDTIEGASGSARGSFSVFLGTGGGGFNSATAPASAVKLLVPTSNGGSRILEVPANMITFEVIDDGSPSSIRFSFDDIERWGFAEKEWSYPGQDGFTEAWAFKSLVLDENQPGIRDTASWQRFKNEPLQHWLLEHSSEIVLTLSQEELDQLL